jgi:hypothetical protein
MRGIRDRQHAAGGVRSKPGIGVGLKAALKLKGYGIG